MKIKRHIKFCILSVFLLLVTVVASACLSNVAWAVDLPFNQNQGGQGGYQAGAYDLNAEQPTADNWTRQSRFVGGNSPRLKWELNIGSSIDATPVVGADGMIYFGARNGSIYAVDKNGNQKWSFSTGYEIVSSPAIAGDGTILVSSKDGCLYALDSSGGLKWAYTSSNIFEASPVIGTDGVIYLGSKDGRLFAINPDGSEKWIINTAGIDFPVAIGQDGCIYTSSRDGTIFCINPSGIIKWKTSLEGILNSPALDKEGNIYVCSGAYLNVLNPKGGIRFRYDLNGAEEVKSPITLGPDGSVYVGANQLYRFSPGGSSNWTSGIYNATAPILDANGKIFIASSYLSGRLYALNQDGRQIWDYSIGGAEQVPVLGSDGTIYIGSRDGRLYAIDTIPFEVASTDVSESQKDVALDKSITITFTKDTIAGTGYERIKLIDTMAQPIGFSRRLLGNKLVIEPDTDLKPDQNYVLRIPADALKDATGGTLAEEFVLRFSTYSNISNLIQAEFTIGQKIYRVAGQDQGMDAEPFVQNGRSFVPVRFLAMALGVPENNVKWNEPERKVTLEKDSTYVEMIMGSDIILVNSKETKMEVAPLNHGQRIYLPARYVAEAFGYDVLWDQTRQAVYVSLPGQLGR